ncbi:SDR family oxidoreductase [Fodinisporobacter ferrooxydans]|uniref:SDR family oxidoreductase n=1 Tax=Fodinisporobacter ferrooxydans TaxID=2901836 RepID=A0ABY4CKN3_9BACL|nr:SDR family oxidoreductase [Alicyclobacillaceae bacterium MYW30-H2]
MSICGKKVVVLGGSSGMGLATAQAVVEQGGHVMIASRTEQKLKSAADKVKKNVETYVLDATDEKAVQEFFDKVGNFDHLVSTAADGLTGDFLELPVSEARKTFESKFWGQYYAAKYGAPCMNQGGSITFCTGLLSRRPMHGYSILSAINGGIEALARAIAIEVNPIRVNVVSPGIVDTPLYENLSTEERIKYFNSLIKKLPVQKIGKSYDIAHAILYLMTNEFTTGTVLEVNGGHLLV